MIGQSVIKVNVVLKLCYRNDTATYVFCSIIKTIIESENVNLLHLTRQPHLYFNEFEMENFSHQYIEQLRYMNEVNKRRQVLNFYKLRC